MQKLKIFITGGSSFIGRNFIEQLGERFDIIAPVHAELDLTDSAAVYVFLEKNSVDVVLHAANVGGNSNPKLTGVDWVFEKNLQMFFNLIRSKKYFKRMIVLGSGAEYDKRHDLVKIKEEDFDRSIPIDKYGFSKYIMSKYAQNVDFITHLRLFGVYGKYEDYKIRFISETICRVLLNKPIIIKQNVIFDYMYINDVVKIIDNFISRKPNQSFFNAGCGTTIDLLSIANRILYLTGKELPIIVENPGLNKEYSCNIDKLKLEIGELTYADFDISLVDMIAYYRTALPALDTHFVS